MNFSLQSFLKLCALDTGAAIGELQRRVSGAGGYDYYHRLYRAIRLYSLTKDEEDSRAEIAQATNDGERRHNLQAFENFLERFGASRSLKPVALPYAASQMVLRPAPNIGIRVDPLFSAEANGSTQVYSVYAIRDPALMQKYGAVGCHVQRTLLQRSALANGTFSIFDVARKRIFSERQVTNMTAQIFRSDVRRLSADIEDL